MAQGTQIVRQNDFSGGELRDGLKRRDDQPQVLSGARQMRNFRIRASGTMVDRPGRLALFPQAGRTETILMPGDVRFRLSFGNGTIVIYSEADAEVATDTGYPWTLADVQRVSFAVVSRDIVVCYPGMVPRIARYGSDGEWSFSNWAFSTGAQSEIRAPFYRFAETYGISVTPSARTGSITLAFSAAFLDPDHVGAVIRYKGYQVQITAVTNATTATATVLQELPPAQTVTVASVDGFYVGQVVEGDTSNATGEITAVDTGAKTITIQLKSQYNGFDATAQEILVGPTSRSKISAVTSATIQATADWDEQAISNRRGWPQACLYDRTRLEFFDLPALPEGILWSSIDTYTDFLVGADANNAIFEIVPGRKHVLYMLGGPDQFVFTDSGIFFVPISGSLPLKPGNVQFVQLSSDGCGTVRPAITTEGIVFLNTGLKRAIAITLLGATNKPYEANDINELADHLLVDPVCMAFSRGDSGFSERYLYVVNSDGTMAVARLSTNKQWVGWSSWTGAGAIKWASSLGTEVIFNVEYGGGVVLVESLDLDATMDATVTLNDIRPELAPPDGFGPLWFWAGQTVDLIDEGRDLGNRPVDASGEIVALLGDDFTSPTILAGRGWSSTLEPFVPHVQAGQDANQTQRRRRIRQAMVTVIHSTGFTWGERTIPSVFWGEEGGDPPAEREDTYRFRTLGRSMDPRVMLTKDRPGPLEVLEIGMEVTI